jgi:hypothetical protein
MQVKAAKRANKGGGGGGGGVAPALIKDYIIGCDKIYRHAYSILRNLASYLSNLIS